MHSSELAGILEFLRSAERLKNATRSAWTSAGRQESVAEHSWRLCLMALVLRDDYPGIDFAKLIKICVVHDLGEAIGGDVPAPEQAGRPGKAEQERRDLQTLVHPLPARIAGEILTLWDEYEEALSPEAKLAKALDKLETIMQHNQGQNPSGFDYRFNLGYGRRFTDTDASRPNAIRTTRDATAGCRALSAAASISAPSLPAKTTESSTSIASACKRSSSCRAMTASRASTSTIPAEKSRSSAGSS